MAFAMKGLFDLSDSPEGKPEKFYVLVGIYYGNSVKCSFRVSVVDSGQGSEWRESV